jgi:AraC-like DNA-binding protein
MTGFDATDSRQQRPLQTAPRQFVADGSRRAAVSGEDGLRYPGASPVKRSVAPGDAASLPFGPWVEQHGRIEWADLALACGYYDQAHFIHDFKSFSGFSPSDYLIRGGERFGHVPLAG